MLHDNTTRRKARCWHTVGVASRAGLPPSTKGRLLVATPPLADHHFDRSVIYMIEHHDDGALGVILNRPSAEHLDAPLERWADLLSEPAVVFGGGPVEIDGLIALAALETTPDETLAEHLSTLAADIFSVDLAADPALISGLITELRVFRGYAGWGPLQLETELDEGAWLVLDIDQADVFSAEPTGLWRRVLSRQDGRLAWLANVPDDLSAN